MTSRHAKQISALPAPEPPAPREREKPERRAPPMRAPRSSPAWEPIPLHVPVPERPNDTRPTRREQPSSRGVVIIDYGSDE